jgi:8-oxo-dGTP diphosphatase
MFVYDGGVVDETALRAVPAGEEGRGVILVDPADLDGATIPRSANRIRSALTARDPEPAIEAVNGKTR